MKTPKGSKRAARREKARALLAGHGIKQDKFRLFWKLGANENAAKIILEAQATVAQGGELSVNPVV